MKYVKLREAVKILGVHGYTLQKWAREGKIDVLKDPAGNYLYNIEHFVVKYRVQKKRGGKKDAKKGGSETCN